jgi:hypothetical protein
MDIDYNYININSGLKFLIFFLLLYIVSSNIIDNVNNFTRINSILIICISAVIIYYILDKNFPSCNL